MAHFDYVRDNRRFDLEDQRTAAIRSLRYVRKAQRDLCEVTDAAQAGRKIALDRQLRDLGREIALLDLALADLDGGEASKGGGALPDGEANAA